MKRIHYLLVTVTIASIVLGGCSTARFYANKRIGHPTENNEPPQPVKEMYASNAPVPLSVFVVDSPLAKEAKTPVNAMTKERKDTRSLSDSCYKISFINNTRVLASRFEVNGDNFCYMRCGDQSQEWHCLKRDKVVTVRDGRDSIVPITATHKPVNKIHPQDQYQTKTQEVHPLATTGMIMGALGILLLLFAITNPELLILSLIFGAIGLIFGIVSLVNIIRKPHLYKGKELAIYSIVFSAIPILIILGLVVAFMFFYAI